MSEWLRYSDTDTRPVYPCHLGIPGWLGGRRRPESCEYDDDADGESMSGLCILTHGALFPLAIISHRLHAFLDKHGCGQSGLTVYMNEGV